MHHLQAPLNGGQDCSIFHFSLDYACMALHLILEHTHKNTLIKEQLKKSCKGKSTRGARHGGKTVFKSKMNTIKVTQVPPKGINPT